MKKMLSILLTLGLILSIAIPAFAETATFTNFKLMNGVNGKQQTATVEKGTPTGSSSTTVIDSISGATASQPMVARVRHENDARASSTFDIYAVGTYYKGWYENYGIKGDRYYLRMQNTTGGPTVTVSGSFTP